MMPLEGIPIMAHCPTCSAPVSDGRFCSPCGGTLSPSGEDPTRTTMPEGDREQSARPEKEPPTATINATLTTLALVAFYFSLAGRSVVKGELLGEWLGWFGR